MANKTMPEVYSEAPPNGETPAHPCTLGDLDWPGMTKEEYARIEVAKAMIEPGRSYSVDTLNDMDRRARYLANLLVGGT